MLHYVNKEAQMITEIALKCCSSFI